MKLTLEERIAHGGHKVLRWMMDNVYVRQDPAGNIKMDKEKSTEKIYGENRCSSSNRYGYSCRRTFGTFH